MQKVVLITGASGGLGSFIAHQFIENDDIVYVSYLHNKEDALKLVVNENVRAIKCDITSESDIESMISIIEREEGHLDILINNAAISRDSEIAAKNKKSFQEVLDVNLIGTFLVSKYAHEIMDKGVIINVASNTALDAYYPYGLDYDASKAGVISLTHNLSLEYAPNIRVNAVAPGWINTKMNAEMDEEFRALECDKILLERFAEPEEIANVVFFLASDKASYINNSVIRVDGGLK